MLKWISKKRNRKGFTLVELVVVIAILGILAAIAVPKLSKSRESAAIAAHNANVRTLYSAASMYIAEHGVPSEGIEWDKDSKDNSKGKDDGFGWDSYLQGWPKAPTGLGTDVDGEEYEVIINTNGDIDVKNGEVTTNPTDPGDDED